MTETLEQLGTKMSAHRTPDDDHLSEAFAWCGSLPTEIEQQAVLMMRRVFDKWSLFVLGVIGKGEPVRFSAVSRALPGVAQKVLTRTLRDLEADELISRQVYPEAVLRVEYALTPSGRELLQIAAPLFAWHVRRLVNEPKPDPTPAGSKLLANGAGPPAAPNLSALFEMAGPPSPRATDRPWTCQSRVERPPSEHA
jgi:DNA-binding HxlR family transcriptional regulator